jgi:hypothetical protein
MLFVWANAGKIGHKHAQLQVHAVAAPEAPSVTTVFEKDFPLGSGNTIKVESSLSFIPAVHQAPMGLLACSHIHLHHCHTH